MSEPSEPIDRERIAELLIVAERATRPRSAVSYSDFLNSADKFREEFDASEYAALARYALAQAAFAKANYIEWQKADEECKSLTTERDGLRERVAQLEADETIPNMMEAMRDFNNNLESEQATNDYLRKRELELEARETTILTLIGDKVAEWREQSERWQSKGATEANEKRQEQDFYDRDMCLIKSQAAAQLLTEIEGMK